jgi:hypothetical protein
MGIDFKSFEGHERGPVVHHRDDLPNMVGGHYSVNGVTVSVGRDDNDHLHVLGFDGRALKFTLAPGAPLSALVEKIRDGDVAGAVKRLAERASRYAQKRRYFDGPITYPPSGIA